MKLIVCTVIDRWKDCDATSTFTGSSSFAFFAPDPIVDTLPFTAPAATSIITGVTAFSSDDIIPLPFCKRFGLTTPKPVVDIDPLKRPLLYLHLCQSGSSSTPFHTFPFNWFNMMLIPQVLF